MNISSEKLDKLVERYAEYRECNTDSRTLALMACDELGIEVEHKPCLLPCVTGGSFKRSPEAFFSGGPGYYKIYAGGTTVATEVYNGSDGNLMAQSKGAIEDLAEVLIFLRSQSRNDSQVLRDKIVNRLEDAGANMGALNEMAEHSDS